MQPTSNEVGDQVAKIGFSLYCTFRRKQKRKQSTFLKIPFALLFSLLSILTLTPLKKIKQNLEGIYCKVMIKVSIRIFPRKRGILSSCDSFRIPRKFITFFISATPAITQCYKRQEAHSSILHTREGGKGDIESQRYEMYE